MMDTLQSYLDAGFTEKYARIYLNSKNKALQEAILDPGLINYAYNHGFKAASLMHYADAAAIRYTDVDLSQYLCDRDYYRLWPLNDWSRIWINDKLTLKYMLAGTQYTDVMPTYYWFSQNGKLRRLLDNDRYEQSTNGFLSSLRDVRIFACKPANGTLSAGFNKMSYQDGVYRLNDVACTEEDIIRFTDTHPNFIYTEYLTPCGELSPISDKIHTIRIMVLNEDGIHPRIIPCCYIRFGTAEQGASNLSSVDNKADYSLFCGVDIETGAFGKAYAFYADKVVEVDRHPDSHYPLTGSIPHWDKVRDTILGIAKHLFSEEWIGFDACVDAGGNVRIMEINSHPGISYAQVYRPLMTIPFVKDYITRKSRELDELTAEQVQARNRIIR